MDLFVISIYGFGAWFSLLVGVGRLIKPWHRNNVIPALFFIVIGYLIFYFALINTRELLQLPWLLHTVHPLLFAVGPLAYFYLVMISSADFYLRFKHVRHFVPAFVTVIILIPEWVLPIDIKRELVLDFLDNKNFRWLKGLALAGNFSIFVYIVAIFKEIIPLYPLKGGESKYLSGLAMLWLIALGFGFYSILSMNFSYMVHTNIMIVVSVAYLYLISEHNPRFLSQLSSSMRARKYSGKYEKSLLKNLDLEGLDYNLQSLLEEEGMFLKEDLSLQSVAERLGLSSHQLSQYLNEHKQMNFNAFINRYRVEAACKMLLEEKEKTVLNIALDVGFNSLSTFNEAFRKVMGVAPTLYRKNAEK